MVPPNDNGQLENVLKNLGISSSIHINDVQDLLKEQNKANDSVKTRVKREQITHMGWFRYYTLDEIYDYIKFLKSQYASHV